MDFYVWFFALLTIAGVFPALDRRLHDIDDEIEYFQCLLEEPEQRADRRFRHHQIELKRYYDQTLNQSSLIFYVGIFNILLGVSIIFIFGYFITISKLDAQTKIIVGALGAVGSILSNYIAIIYGGMFKELIKSLTEFHNRLVTTNHLYYGLFLSSQIKEDKELLNKTLSKMAINTSLSIGTSKSMNETDTDKEKEEESKNQIGYS
jgi:hypothetical protein